MFTFTVPDDIEAVVYNELPDGTYRGRVKGLQRNDKGYGEFIQVKWRIIEPIDYLDWTKSHFFSVGSSDPEKQQKAIARFTALCRDVFLIKPGEVLTEDKAIGKEAWITQVSSVGENGKLYRNIVKWKPVTDGNDLSFEKPPATTMYGNIPVPNPAASGFQVPINDEVPF